MYDRVRSLSVLLFLGGGQFAHYFLDLGKSGGVAHQNGCNEPGKKKKLATREVTFKVGNDQKRNEEQIVSGKIAQIINKRTNDDNVHKEGKDQDSSPKQDLEVRIVVAIPARNSPDSFFIKHTYPGDPETRLFIEK